MDTSGVSQRRTITTGFSIFHNVWHVVILLLLAVSCVTAYDLDEYNSALFQRLAELGEIHVDVRQPPIRRQFGVDQRNAENESTSTSSSPTRSVSSSASTITVSASPSATGNTTASSPSNSTIQSSTSTQTVPTTLPTPFDTSLGNNFTASSCPAFFNKFLNNATFIKCLPVSLLLQNSMQFNRALKSGPYLRKILDTSCAAPLATCSPLMTSIAHDLIDDANCGADYDRQNLVVMQAYTGLMAYEPLFKATCLSNKATGNYCFADAVVNATNPSDLYPYFTALGLALPSSARPTCSTCLQQAMQIFASYAGQSDQPLSGTYIASAQQIDGVCGSDFATTNVKVTTKSASTNAAARSISSAYTVGITAAAISWLMSVL